MNRTREAVPTLRFPEYLDSGPWIPVPLHQVLEYERPDSCLVKDAHYRESGIPVLTANKSFLLGYTHEKDHVYQDLPVVIFDDFTTEKKYVDFPFKVKSSAIKLLKARGDNVLKFLYELMNTIRFEAAEHKRYYISAYQHLIVWLPAGIEEQQKIADCFFSVDALIDAESRKLAALQKHKRGLLQKLFPAGRKSGPEWRFPEFQKSGAWEWKKLDDIGKIVTGKTPPTSKAALWDGDIPFVTPTDMTGEKYQSNTQRQVTRTASMKILPEHTVLFTCIASIGKMALSTGPCVTNQQINAILPEEDWHPELVYYSLLSRVASIKAALSNTTLPIINKTDFSKIRIPVTQDRKEQEKIVGCLSEADALIAAQSRQLAHLQAHKKGLAQGLFPSRKEAEK